ncbi:AzlD domain-containing protein [Reinekea sp. G2M2-21]|uniref:AzlD domain-containing protein n=1 Tax=Reinekea sp. G2M2-21 TaxID=2788942 RepID=UPI0018ABE959|nr:AzlD domain-containing protein [Reinekea sp. G2M2-21]
MSSIMLILGMMAVTWGVRAVPFVLPNLNLSPGMLNFLNCIPAAVLAALVAEPILNPVVNQASLLAPELIAALVCVVMGVFRAPMLATVIVGMVSFVLLSQFN